jgi:hypothetical protein
MKFHFFIFCLLLLLFNTDGIPSSTALSTPPTHRLPYQVILVLPAKESIHNTFGLTVDKTRPVIDISVEDVVKAEILPPGWINLTYHDSRYWEDHTLAERWATTGVVQAYCERRLDAIMGFADEYSLATVAKVSAGFGEGGVPVITTAGLTSSIGSRKSYPYLTRMQGSYRVMGKFMWELMVYNLKYRNVVFMYHDKKRARNKPVTSKSPKEDTKGSKEDKGEETKEEYSTQCYFSSYAVKQVLSEYDTALKTSWIAQTPHVAFDEDIPMTKEDTLELVKQASMESNGQFFLLI